MTAKPHSHADLLHAIANGEQMEILDTRTDCWVTETGERALQVIASGYGEYVRVKPAKREARRWWLYKAVDVYGPDWPAHLKPDALVAFERSSVNAIPVREVLPDEQ